MSFGFRISKQLVNVGHFTKHTWEYTWKYCSFWVESSCGYKGILDDTAGYIVSMQHFFVTKTWHTWPIYIYRSLVFSSGMTWGSQSWGIIEGSQVAFQTMGCLGFWGGHGRFMGCLWDVYGMSWDLHGMFGVPNSYDLPDWWISHPTFPTETCHKLIPSGCRINPWDDCRTQDLGSNMESYQETHVFEHVDFWAE